jgi:hypothetical protein
VGAGARRDPHGERATDELERIADFIYTRTS